MRPGKLCAEPGCSAVVIRGLSRCATHGQQRRAQRNAERGGSGSAWEAIRRQVFTRDMGFCVLCRVRLMLGTARIDHIQPLGQGGTNEPGNLRTLCLACHRAQPTTRGGG